MLVSFALSYLVADGYREAVLWKVEGSDGDCLLRGSGMAPTRPASRFAQSKPTARQYRAFSCMSLP